MTDWGPGSEHHSQVTLLVVWDFEVPESSCQSSSTTALIWGLGGRGLGRGLQILYMFGPGALRGSTQSKYSTRRAGARAFSFEVSRMRYGGSAPKPWLSGLLLRNSSRCTTMRMLYSVYFLGHFCSLQTPETLKSETLNPKTCNPKP